MTAIIKKNKNKKQTKQNKTKTKKQEVETERGKKKKKDYRTQQNANFRHIYFVQARGREAVTIQFIKMTKKVSCLILCDCVVSPGESMNIVIHLL